MKNKSSVEWLINQITEEQMIKAKSLNEWLEIFEQAKSMHKKEVESLNQIELPTDEDIKDFSFSRLTLATQISGFQLGAKWMRDKIITKLI